MREKGKRAIVMLLAITLISGSLFATGNQETKSPAKESGTSYKVTDKVEIELWGIYVAEKQECIEKIISNYNASQDLVTVKYVSLGSYNATDEALTAAQAAGKGLPGLAFINVPRVQTYAASGMIEPLDGYIKATNFDITDINEGMMAGMTYDTDGHVYAMPWGISSAIYYWNMDILKAIGRTEPPKTWNELKKLAPEVMQKTGEKLFTTHCELNYDEVMLRNAGADPLGDGVKENMMDSHILSFIKDYKDLIDAGYVSYYTGADAESSQLTDFYNGGALCMIETSSILNNVVKKSNFAVGASFPLVDKVTPAISCIAGGTVIIPAENTQNVKSAAWDFITYALKPENIVAWSEVGAVYPVRKSVYTSDQLLSGLYANQPLFKSVYPYMDSLKPKNKTSYQTACYKVIGNALSEYYSKGGNLEEIWSKAQKEVQNILAGI